MNLQSYSSRAQFRRAAWTNRTIALTTAFIGLALAGDQATAQVRRPVVSDPVRPDTFQVDLRLAPRVTPWQPGDSIRVVPQGLPPEFDAARDTLNVDLSKTEVIKPWQPGDPIRIIPEGEYPGELKEVPPDTSAKGFEPVAIPPPTVVAGFPGIPATGFVPPDVVGDVGPDHFVQMVNTALAIYDKAGALLAGPTPINTLWNGFGGQCETGNRGDPIVQYDHLADRWLISQFAFDRDALGNAIPPFLECIAISRSPNPVTGGWFRYGFTVPAFPDYPKIGLWPDGYYMSTYEGANLGLFAFDRTNMLNGAAAGFVRFTIPALAAGRARTRILPSDLDGLTPPPAGSPNYFVRSVDGAAQGGGADRLEIFAFSVDFTNPANSTLVGPTTLTTTPYDIVMCGNALPRNCIPQPGTTQRLDPLSNRLMRRLQYRNFGTHETLVANQTVDANGSDVAGIRWYELRAVGGVWAINQQGTYSPDNVNRWMGSIAMDQGGNMALAYSAASASVSPGIRLTGRLATDPSGTMGGETVLVAGGGSQTGSSRWGDYSSMNVDIRDDCTFWYTSEFYQTTTTGGWSTRVDSFIHPSCSATSVVPWNRRGLSIHAGAAIPFGTLNTSTDIGPTLNIDLVFPIAPNWAWDARLGYSRFQGSGGASDVEVLNLSSNLKFVPFLSTPWVFLNGGLGLYYVDFSDLEAGFNVGAGVGQPLGADFTLEGTLNYHSTFTASPDIEFGKLQLGLIWHF